MSPALAGRFFASGTPGKPCLPRESVLDPFSTQVNFWGLYSPSEGRGGRRGGAGNWAWSLLTGAPERPPTPAPASDSVNLSLTLPLLFWARAFTSRSSFWHVLAKWYLFTKMSISYPDQALVHTYSICKNVMGGLWRPKRCGQRHMTTSWHPIYRYLTSRENLRNTSSLDFKGNNTTSISPMG